MHYSGHNLALLGLICYYNESCYGAVSEAPCSEGGHGPLGPPPRSAHPDFWQGWTSDHNNTVANVSMAFMSYILTMLNVMAESMPFHCFFNQSATVIPLFSCSFLGQEAYLSKEVIVSCFLCDFFIISALIRGKNGVKSILNMVNNGLDV